jgi:hypothetical protein
VKPVEERFRAKVGIDRVTGCWMWMGPTDGVYGTFHVVGRRNPQKAHRVAYELFVGPIPEGLHIDHLCRVQLCVNPAHLEAVTPAENVRREYAAVLHPNSRKTHCPHGHPYDAANTRIVMRRGRPGRFCRTCHRADANRRSAERRGVHV